MDCFVFVVENNRFWHTAVYYRLTACYSGKNAKREQNELIVFDEIAVRRIRWLKNDLMSENLMSFNRRRRR